MEKNYNDLPLVIVHGLGDSPKLPWWGFLKKYIRENTDSEIFSIDLSTEIETPFEKRRVKVPGTALGSIKDYAKELEDFVGRIESDVNIIAHSLGGLVSRWYIEMMGGSQNVEKIVTLATPHQGTYMAYAGILSPAAREMVPGSDLIYSLNSHDLPAEVDYTAVWGIEDRAFVQKWRSKLPENLVVFNENARNVCAGDVDHLEMVYSKEVFELYKDFIFKGPKDIKK